MSKLYQYLPIFTTCTLLICHTAVAISANTYEICWGNNSISTAIEVMATAKSNNVMLSTTRNAQSHLLYEKGQLYVKIRDSFVQDISCETAQHLQKSPFKQLVNTYGITSLTKAFSRLPQMAQHYKLIFTQTDKTLALIEALQAYPMVVYAEQVPRYRTFYTPNDIHPDQYNVGITQAEAAWDLTLGSSDIVIGMVDDAVLLDHEDLADNIWVNPGEIAGNGIDDDGNGYIDDVNGWDAADNDNDPNPGPGADNFYFSHGTHCAGIAASVTDNGIGIASVSFNTQLMAVKIGADSDSGLSGAMAGVEYAIAAGAHVISMSWGGGPPSDTDQAVFDVAHNAGIVLVAAAGNDNTDELMYPASYNHIISVAATNDNDLKASFTNYGDSIDVCAPGVQIWSSVATNNSAYEFYDGTSMACPYVSGLAALMLSYDPTASPDRIEECLKETADDIYPLNPDYIGQLGAGRVNAFEAVKCTPSVPFASFTTSAVPPCAGETITLLDTSGGTELDSWNWSMPDATPSSSTEQNPVVTFPADGNYDVTLIVGNALGADTLTQVITVAPPTATMTGEAVIFQGYVVPLTFTFTGSPPYSVSYSDGLTIETINGITENPFQVEVAPQATTSYSITAMNNASCMGTVEGAFDIIVIVPTEPNDICDYALPFPSLTAGVESCIVGDNSSANGELPYINQANCLGVEVPIPAADLWYSFEGVSNILNIDLTFDMDTAVISLYEGTCDGLIGRACELATGGSLQTEFSPVAAGVSYFLQVSGGSNTDIGDFQLCIENTGESIDEICILGQRLEVNPLPNFGTYLPGEEVHFCFTVEDYNQNAVDWIHGIVPDFGSGWDVSTLTNIVAPPSCTGGGGVSWDWYDTPIQGESPYALTIGPQGPGFFYETTSGSSSGVIDAMPGNNFGDAGADGCEWEFCFSIATVAACPPGIDGEDLSIRFLNFSDSETGSWGVFSICPEDPDYVFKATLVCCPIPEMTGINPTCSQPDIGEITATATSALPPFTYNWSTGFSETTAGSSTISGLTADFYTVTVTDNDGCESIASFTLFEQAEGTVIDLSDDATVCRGAGTELSVSGGVEFIWSPSGSLSDSHIANPFASPDTTTTYIVVVTDATGCSAYDQVTVTVLDAPIAITSNNVGLCPGESTLISAIGGVSYEWSPTDGLDDPTSPNPTVTPSESTTYVVTVTDANGCTASADIIIQVDSEPYFPIEPIDTMICANQLVELPLTDIYPIAGNTYEWSPTTGLDNPNMPNPIASISESIEYTITVTNQQGCQVVESVAIEISEMQIEVNLGADTLLCNGDALTLMPDASFDAYLWSDGSEADSLLISESGLYSLTVSNADGCAAVAEVEVTYETVVPDIIGELNILQGESTELATSVPYAEYEWSTGELSETITVSESGAYSVTVTGENGCTGSDMVNVNVQAVNDLLIPNAFSPNSDGVNDAFNVYSTNPITDYYIAIYDRWGKQLFSSTDINQSWEGRLNDIDMNIGVYVYYINATFVDNTTKQYKGNITLIK